MQSGQNPKADLQRDLDELSSVLREKQSGFLSVLRDSKKDRDFILSLSSPDDFLKAQETVLVDLEKEFSDEQHKETLSRLRAYKKHDALLKQIKPFVKPPTFDDKDADLVKDLPSFLQGDRDHLNAFEEKLKTLEDQKQIDVLGVLSEIRIYRTQWIVSNALRDIKPLIKPPTFNAKDKELVENLQKFKEGNRTHLIRQLDTLHNLPDEVKKIILHFHTVRVKEALKNIQHVLREEGHRQLVASIDSFSQGDRADFIKRLTGFYGIISKNQKHRDYQYKNDIENVLFYHQELELKSKPAAAARKSSAAPSNSSSKEENQKGGDIPQAKTAQEKAVPPTTASSSSSSASTSPETTVADQSYKAAESQLKKTSPQEKERTRARTADLDAGFDTNPTVAVSKIDQTVIE